MAEKLFKDVDLLFEGKPRWTSETQTVGLKIPEFLKKIEEKEDFDSPRFKLSGVEFCISVKPGSEFIQVAVLNCSKKNQTTSGTIFLGFGDSICHWEMKEVPAGAWVGNPKLDLGQEPRGCF